MRRFYGKVASLRPNNHVPISFRYSEEADAKRRIGALAASLAPADPLTVAMNGGTTVRSVAQCLAARAGLTVVTNSMATADPLLAKQRVHVHGLTADDEDEALAGYAMVEQSRRAIVVADSRVIPAHSGRPDRHIPLSEPPRYSGLDEFAKTASRCTQGKTLAQRKSPRERPQSQRKAIDGGWEGWLYMISLDFPLVELLPYWYAPPIRKCSADVTERDRSVAMGICRSACRPHGGHGARRH